MKNSRGLDKEDGMFVLRQLVEKKLEGHDRASLLIIYFY